MTSPYWDEKLAEHYRRFQYRFTDRPLAGQLIALAGGTGGLGGATTMLLGREGARLIVGYRANRERAEALRAAISVETGQAITLIEGDLALPAVRHKFGEAADALGAPLSGLAIFSGEAARVPWESLDVTALETSARANYVAPILLAKEVGDRMEKSGGGNIVLLATMQAIVPFRSSLNYAAPKAALAHAARILARQWRHVRINVVAPGATVAGMAEATVRTGKYDRYIEAGAVSRFGRPEDIAHAVRFFLEPDSYMTGQVLLVDGGLTLFV